MIKSPSRLVSLLAVAVLLVACGSRISQENFNRIADGMPYADVVKILGEPTSSEARGVLGVSATTAKWKDKEHQITIVFVNQKVTSKTFREAKDAPKE
jgi:outer membrane protein assembly factor BamE (lipoprotein component of BamABCDE complex)